MPAFAYIHMYVYIYIYIYIYTRRLLFFVHVTLLQSCQAFNVPEFYRVCIYISVCVLFGYLSNFYACSAHILNYNINSHILNYQLHLVFLFVACVSPSHFTMRKNKRCHKRGKRVNIYIYIYIYIYMRHTSYIKIYVRHT